MHLPAVDVPERERKEKASPRTEKVSKILNRIHRDMQKIYAIMDIESPQNFAQNAPREEQEPE